MDKYWKLSEQTEYAEKATKSLSGMLTMIRDCLPREKGNGWKLPTFHNTMHIVNDMCKYGKPKEANTEVGEKNHIVFAKKIGRRCRKQHRTFTNQVAVRLSDSFIIQRLVVVMGLVDEDQDDDDDDDDGNEDFGKAQNGADESSMESTNGATHSKLIRNGNSIEETWTSKTEKHLLTWDFGVATCIYAHYTGKYHVTTIHCCTEYVQQKFRIRCHPSYQGQGPWFDWVCVHFEACTHNGKSIPKGDYPCKLLSIIPKQHNVFLEETEVVVQRAQFRTGNDSVLFTEWELMAGYHVVSLSKVVDILFTLELENNKIAVALPYSEWPSCFTDTSY